MTLVSATQSFRNSFIKPDEYSPDSTTQKSNAEPKKSTSANLEKIKDTITEATSHPRATATKAMNSPRATNAMETINKNKGRSLAAFVSLCSFGGPIGAAVGGAIALSALVLTFDAKDPKAVENLKKDLRPVVTSMLGGLVGGFIGAAICTVLGEFIADQIEKETPQLPQYAPDEPLSDANRGLDLVRPIAPASAQKQDQLPSDTIQGLDLAGSGVVKDRSPLVKET